MNISVNINKELWQEIEQNYGNKNYSGAILDAMRLLTKTIRNKTGLEGDGSNLIGQALGGENPKIKITKLQTDSEKNIQKGMQDILRGFYTGIRNPRSHDKLNDEKSEADAIIIFINYMLNIIDKSTLSFQEEEFLERVFDEYYVKNMEYSNLLVQQIPNRQKCNIAIQVFLNKDKGDIYVLEYFMKALFSNLNDDEIDRIYKIVGEELVLTDSKENIRRTLGILPGKYWNRLDKAIKLRIEHILFEDVELGTNDSDEDGVLGTWITYGHLLNFEYINEWIDLLVDKLKKGGGEKEYVDEYFWEYMCLINKENLKDSFKNYIAKGLQHKDNEIINRVNNEIKFNENHLWWDIFEKEIEEIPNIKFVQKPKFSKLPKVAKC